MDTTTVAPDATAPPAGPVSRVDLWILGAELALIAAAAVVGAYLTAHGVQVRASAAPLAARFLPHVGPGTVLAVGVAALVVTHGQAVASTMRWRRLLATGYGLALAWTLGLALVDGWSRGIAGRLTVETEYLHDLPQVAGIGALLRGFASHIVGSPQSPPWTVHVAGHPPGAFLVFVVLDRIGLRGGGPAGLACILVGALAPVCVAITMRALGDERLARAAMPFLVLFPGAVWVGTSADGLFAGVAAAGVALVAIGGLVRATVGGLLLGYTLYLSYGLVLFALAVAAVLVARRHAGVALVVGGGIAAVVVAFTAAGFWWPTGYRLVKVRYYGGVGGVRPYDYWLWANLACLVTCAGPAVGPALARAARAAWRSWRTAAPVWVAAGCLAAIAAADLSGLSKAETERIWLPYAIWLLAAAAYLPARGQRGWLALQAATALIINHLLLTHW